MMTNKSNEDKTNDAASGQNEPVVMNEITVVKTVKDTANWPNGTRITLSNKDGKVFTVNVPEDVWGDGFIYGLNLVFDHSGEGDHYS